MGVIPAENMDLECFVAIRASDVRITLRCTFHSVLTCSQYVRVALCVTSRLQLDYVDLYLIHNPKGKNVAETWNAMLEVRSTKRVCDSAYFVCVFGV